MIDIILRSPVSQAAILNALVAKNLLTQGTDLQSNIIYTPATGFDYCWWAGSGRVMTKAPVVDDQGNVTSQSVFMPGFAMICRIYDSLFISDQITNPVDGEQWSRSKIAQAIKAAGTPGTIGTPPINFYQAGNIQIFRAADVAPWRAANNLPGHEWAGGNSF